MNRIDRLLAIVLELQGKRWRRAEDLAETFETSKRTIYRDMLALGEAGVPIVSIPGRGYSLVEGYFLPPVSFSADEATILLLGADVMAQSFDAHYKSVAHSASRKILGVLPDAQRQTVESLRERIQFVTGSSATRPDTAQQLEKLQLLRGTIVESRRVRFDYHTRYTARGAAIPSDAPTRNVDPYSLAHVGASWYLTGYCHTRRGLRTFRLERIENLIAQSETFERPATVRLNPRQRQQESPITIRALFAPEVARWVRESPSYFTLAMDDTPDGLLVTLAVRDLSEITQWLLSWGRHVRILEPDALRHLLAEEAAAMLRAYQRD
ncbi:MAG TPA: YafY family protein [Ktedonobacterales bacterium]|jgi:predicted DNA-binding transcriptional regulator YafY